MNKVSLFTIAPAVIAIIIGYIIGNLFPFIKLPQPSQKANQQYRSNPLFERETASIIGSVSSINGNLLTISDQNNQSGQFKASDRISIIKFTVEGKAATPSSDVNSVELNKLANFTLEKVGNDYEIVLIRYLPDPKSIPAS